MIWLLQRFVCFLIVTIKTMVWVLLLDFFESPSWVLSQLLCLLWIVKSFCWSSCTLISHTSHMKKTHHLASLKSCWWFELHTQKTKQKQEVNKKPGDHGNLTEGKTDHWGKRDSKQVMTMTGSHTRKFIQLCENYNFNLSQPFSQ